MLNWSQALFSTNKIFQKLKKKNQKTQPFLFRNQKVNFLDFHHQCSDYKHRKSGKLFEEKLVENTIAQKTSKLCRLYLNLE